MRYICGEYVNFLDSDDRWEPDAFIKAYDFLETHKNEINVASARIRFFGAVSGFRHPLDYKFTENRICDISSEFDAVQLFCNSAFIRADALHGYEFDERLKVSEDSLFMTKIILKKCRYGIIRTAVYDYRRRESGDSVIDTNLNNISWYLDTPEHCYQVLFDYSNEKFGEILPYVQYLVMYDLQWRVKKKIPERIYPEVMPRYREIIADLLRQIEDRIILGQKNIGVFSKIFLLSLKYNRNIMDDVRLDRWNVEFNGLKLFSMRAKNRLQITNMRIRENILYLGGLTQLGVLGDDYHLEIIDSQENIYDMEFFPVRQRDMRTFTGEKIFSGCGFRAEVPLERQKWIRFYLKGKDNTKVLLTPDFGKFGKLDREQPGSYYRHGKFILKYEKGNIKIKSGRKKNLLACEWNYLRNTVLKQKKYKIAFYRLACCASKLFETKPVWIISDRSNGAKDNGEELFKYLSGRNTNFDIYFAVSRQSPDFARMNKFVKVLKIDSVKYRMRFLCAEKIISSRAAEWVIDSFGTEDRELLKDLYDFDFIFLQHGVIQSDFSGWLHCSKKDIRLFVTSTEPEYRSIVDGDYGYTGREVKLTGLARYDSLTDEPVDKIVFHPTWRKYLQGPDIMPGIAGYSDKIKGSEYHRFYYSLINDERLLKVLREHGFTAEFYLHPFFVPNAEDFKGNEVIKVVGGQADYNKIFREAKLLITDYSSVAFDFAYLKKPVIYTQFDYPVFCENHTYTKGTRGYFDYKRDGFGPVCMTYEKTVDAIIDAVRGGCVMDEKYKARVDGFFAYHDCGNCERIYNEILKM